MTIVAPDLLLPDQQGGLLEDEARYPTRQVAPLLIPGILQTREYAAAVAAQHPHLAATKKAMIDLRMKRRNQMLRPTSIERRFVIGSHALYSSPTAPYMLEQIANLIVWAREPHVHIRVAHPVGPTSSTAFMIVGTRVSMESAEEHFLVPGDQALWHAEFERQWESARPLPLA